MAKSSTTFTKGQSGNAKGRPPGKTSRTQFREMVKTALPAIVESLVTAAKLGDVQAAKVVLDRCVPALKPTADALVIKATGTLAEQGKAVISSMTSGHITPDAAKTALDAMGVQARLLEQSDLIQRIEALEALCQPTAKP